MQDIVLQLVGVLPHVACKSAFDFPIRAAVFLQEDIKSFKNNHSILVAGYDLLCRHNRISFYWQQVIEPGHGCQGCECSCERTLGGDEEEGGLDLLGGLGAPLGIGGPPKGGLGDMLDGLFGGAPKGGPKAQGMGYGGMY